MKRYNPTQSFEIHSSFASAKPACTTSSLFGSKFFLLGCREPCNGGCRISAAKLARAV
jgi:hypothetical protein